MVSLWRTFYLIRATGSFGFTSSLTGPGLCQWDRQAESASQLMTTWHAYRRQQLRDDYAHLCMNEKLKLHMSEPTQSRHRQLHCGQANTQDSSDQAQQGAGKGVAVKILDCADTRGRAHLQSELRLRGQLHKA